MKKEGNTQGRVYLRQRAKIFENYSNSLKNWKDRYMVVHPQSRKEHECIYTVLEGHKDEFSNHEVKDELVRDSESTDYNEELVIARREMNSSNELACVSGETEVEH